MTGYSVQVHTRCAWLVTQAVIREVKNVNVTVNSSTRIKACQSQRLFYFVFDNIRANPFCSFTFSSFLDWFFSLVPLEKNYIIYKMGKKEKITESLFTKEEEQLLSDFSRNVSTKSSAMFYGSAFMVSLLPIWLYWRIHMIEIMPAIVWFVLVTLGSTYLIAFAYKNTKFILKHKIAIKREEAVTREITRKYADDKKISKKEKDEKALFQKNDVADFESTAFSIFYNNALFLVIVVLLSFYLLKGFSTTANYIFSVGIASGLIALFSTGTQ